MQIKVGVIFGGPSVEHEVSIISAIQAINNINKDKYEVIPIYISKDRKWYTSNMLTEIDVYKDQDLIKKYAKEVVLYNKNGHFVLQNVKGLFKRIVNEIDIAFPIVHGSNVEDGTLAGYLETIGIPMVGCEVLGAALGQDKVVMKQVFESMGIPVVNYTWFYDIDYLAHKDQIFKDIKKMGYPVVVKPASLGSSIGIAKVKNELDLDKAIKEAMQYDNKLIVEKAVDNMIEVNCSVFGNYEYQENSVIEQVVSSEDLLTYSDKYLGNGKSGKSKGMVSASRIIPAKISKEKRLEVEELAKLVFKSLNLSGVCRIDFLINDETGDIYVNEPNTIPGSLSFYLWEPTGKKYNELLDDMISLGIKNYKQKNRKVISFESNILSNYNGTKGVKNKLK